MPIQWVSRPVRRGVFRTAVFASLVASAMQPTFARADRATPPLGEMIASSSSVALGNVTRVDTGASPSTFTLVVSLTSTIVGRAETLWSVPGSDLEPDSVPRLTPGTQVLAFATSTPGTMNEGRVVPVNTISGQAARNAVETMAAKGAALRLSDVSTLLRPANTADAALPDPVLAMLLEELTLRLTLAESPAVADLACGAETVVLRRAKSWAIERSGALQVSDARVCLEALVTARGEFAIEAASALGELGASESVPALLAVLTSGARDATIRPPRGAGEVKPEPSGQVDPEDDTNAAPDKSETPQVVQTTSDGSAAGDDTAATDDEGAASPVTNTKLEPARRDSDRGLTVAVVHALGRIGSPSAVPTLGRLAKEGGGLALQSTLVDALAEIGDAPSMALLAKIARSNPDPLVRTQAAQTLARTR